MSFDWESALGKGVEVVKRQLPVPPEGAQDEEAIVFSTGSVMSSLLPLYGLILALLFLTEMISARASYAIFEERRIRLPWAI